MELQDGFHDVPRGKIATVVTHLEMRAPVPERPVPAPHGLALCRVEAPDPGWYRALFRRVGAEVAMQNEAGEVKTFYVTRIEDGKLTVDGNHPLAGKSLFVRVNILEVRDAEPGEEMTSGIHAAGPQGTCSIN